jgi:hypothetical protein
MLGGGILIEIACMIQKRQNKNWNEKQNYTDLIITTHACSKNMVIVNIYPLLGEFENMTSLIVVF